MSRVNISKGNGEALTVAREREALPLQLCDGSLREAVDHIAQGICVYDRHDRLVFCSAQYMKLYGLKAGDVKTGDSLGDVIRAQAEHGKIDPAELEDYVLRCQGQSSRPWRMTRRLKDGRTVLVSCRDMTNGFYVATHEDITDRLSSERRIRFAAHHDPLTTLPNRLLFLERLQAALARVKRGDSAALLWIDLDRFKAINDTHGHSVGDKLLCAVAERLSDNVRSTDTVARLGGDEFAVLQVPALSPKAAAALAGRLVEKLNAPYEIDDLPLIVGVSIGVVIATPECADAEQLMRNADFALYRAKNEGRGTFRFFAEELNAEMQRRRALEDAMRRALVLETFQLHYQPIVNLAERRVVAFEALLRWPDRNGGFISPGEFIPIAEENGLIVPLGHWVLHAACRQAKLLPDDLAVSVNISAQQFRFGGVVETIQSALKAADLPAARLQVEVTETIMLDPCDDVRSMLRAIKDLGVRIAMDDFGTGYSSLHYLSSFPFDKLKIDRSFISGLPNDAGRLAILRAIAGLGANLSMVTTAEGVETAEQLDIVRSEGCVEVQGYYFSKPRPIEDLPAVITACARKARATIQLKTNPKLEAFLREERKYV